MLNNNPISIVEDYLYKYQTLDEEVINELNNSLKDDYTDSQKEKYKEVMKEQYRTLTYKIKDDEVNGNKAKVKVSIVVLDYYKALKELNEYYENNKDNLDTLEKLNDYKLEKLSHVKDKVEYTIEFNLIYNNSRWYLTDIDDSILSKINGVYEY